MIQALLLGLLASFFFSLTFVFNHVIQYGGGHWIWTASLRFIFMLPILFLLVIEKKRYLFILKEVSANLFSWLLWSTVGFGFFYLPLCIAASLGPSWLIASIWQITIVAGILLTPLLNKKSNTQKRNHIFPIHQFIISLLIIFGVFLVQFSSISINEIKKNVLALLLVLVAAFSYPLGNRKMMAIVPKSFSTIDRVFGMTFCSLPFWTIGIVIAVFNNIYPTQMQVFQTSIIALSSGVIATILFFMATEKVKNHTNQLAVIESTQAGEVIFTLILGVFLFNDTIPSFRALTGIIIIIVGIILNGVSVKWIKLKNT